MVIIIIILIIIIVIITIIMFGESHPEAIPLLFGRSLIALEKKSGGIRPIAIGYTLCRIVAKSDRNFTL